MRKFFLSLLLAPLLFLSGCHVNDSGEYRFKFQLITEIYKPFNYIEDDQLTGLAPDLLKEICLKLNIPFKVSVLPWEEGYNLLQNSDNAVLFSISMNASRRDLFKWAGPIASIEWFFYGLSEKRLTLGSLDEAKNSMYRIGVLKDYSIEQFLVKQGFTNLVYCNDHDDAVNKLLQGAIDFYPSVKFTTEASMQKLGKSFFLLSEVLPVRTELTYFAFSKSIPDDVVADFQQEIDRLKNNGTLKSLYQKYFNSSDYPGTLQIYTEDYPPLTFLNKYGEVTGYGTDIVKEIMKRNAIFENIKLSSWSNGYDLALLNPNFCLFTMDRTQLRENLFNWVGPIGTNTTYFYTKSGSGIQIKSVDDAKKLSSVGTVSSWFSDQYLRSLGFANLLSDKDPMSMATKLIQGKVDAFVCSSVTFPDIVKAAGFTFNEVTPSYALMSSDFYIAFSKNTLPSTVNLWQSTFDGMKKDGTLDAIRKKWFP